jgi:hypothetical protein
MLVYLKMSVFMQALTGCYMKVFNTGAASVKFEASDLTLTPVAENPTPRISSHDLWRKIRRFGFLPDSVGGKSEASDFFPSGFDN